MTQKVFTAKKMFYETGTQLILYDITNSSVTENLVDIYLVTESEPRNFVIGVCNDSSFTNPHYILAGNTDTDFYSFKGLMLPPNDLNGKKLFIQLSAAVSANPLYITVVGYEI